MSNTLSKFNAPSADVPGLHRRGRLRLLLAGALLAASAVWTRPAAATTKGLNQIVTPDVQPAGSLSVSYQQQDPYIGNPSQIQLELGITHRFEVAYFQGFSPGAEVFNFEYGIIQQKHALLSAGVSGWSLRGPIPWPYVEGGYYIGNTRSMAGVTRINNVTELVLGYGYQIHPRTLIQLDYQSGPGNSATAGFNYVITPTLSCNPAVYIANDAPHHIHGYIVLTWNIQVFSGK